MIQRKYSKTVAAANHVVWTGREVLPAPYALQGLVSDQVEFGIFRVAGRALYCSGFTVYFQNPAADRFCSVAVEIQSASGVTVPNSVLHVDGVTSGAELQLAPALPMPADSLWKFFVRAAADDPGDLPQGLVATYQLRYANGPLRTDFWSNGLTDQGIGFWDLNGNFIVT